MNEAPLVSVCIITYNHVKYITQAIESVLAQEVSFPWELIIADDFSTDGTREILVEFENRFPTIIKLILQDHNIGAARNWRDLISSPLSKYIAYFEGDDYWCDSRKLQKQVNFLETNTKYIACSSDVFELVDSEMKIVNCKSNIISSKDLMTGNTIYTSSVLYRNLITYPEWLWQCKIGDWILWLLLTRNGPFYNMSEPMSVYRMHHGGSWIGKGKEKNLMDIVDTYDLLISNMGLEYKSDLKSGAKQYYSQLLDLLSTKKSLKVVYWTSKAFMFDFDVRWFKYLIRSIFNLLKF